MTTVLLLEDDAWLGESYQALMRRAGYTVIAAADGQEALSCIEQHNPDVIVADVLLRGQTVFALLHELQSYDDTRTLPVILCTGLDVHSLERDRLHSYGVVSVLQKSTLTPEQLLQAVRESVL